LADAARSYNWTTIVEKVRAPALANTTRPGSTSGFAPLHQVAHGGGPSSVAMALITRGAWRSLRDHAVIRGRVGDLEAKKRTRLLRLAPMPETFGDR
jgi:hypothetical protein